MNDEFKQKLLAEINKSGFSHEMDIIKRLRADDLIVFPNLAYVDADSKPHELDAYVGFRDYDRVKRVDEVALNLTIECKSSSDKPWVFFDDPGDTLAMFGLVDRMLCFTDFEMKDSYTPLAGCFNSALRGHHYNDNTIPIARTHLEAFGKDSGKEIYQGITSLWYAIDYFKRLFAKTSPHRSPANKRIDFMHPLIILKGVLVSARRDNDGFEIKEVPHVMIRTIDCVTDKELDFRVATKEIIIDVIRSDYLENYLQICRKDLDLCTTHIEQLFRADWMIRDINGASQET